MTKDMISETAALKALLSETADNQVLAEMLGFGVNRLMTLDVDHLRRQHHGPGKNRRPLNRLNIQPENKLDHLLGHYPHIGIG